MVVVVGVVDVVDDVVVVAVDVLGEVVFDKVVDSLVIKDNITACLSRYIPILSRQLCCTPSVTSLGPMDATHAALCHNIRHIIEMVIS